MSTVERFFIEINVLQEKAKYKIINKLKEKKPKIVINNRGGVGKNTLINDRSSYMWISTKYKRQHYNITLFYSEIDCNTGNCHSQIGRIMFVKDLVLNKNKKTYSPNIILKNDINKFITSKKRTHIEFFSYKWINPLLYMDEITPEKYLINKKWITVDDINASDKITECLVNAFIKFVQEHDKKHD